MPELPVVSGRQSVSVFVSFGWVYRHHTGSHMILTKPGERFNLSIPDRQVVSKGLLRDQLRKAGIGVEEFVTRLRSLR